jgi:hypothetical protein
MTTASQERVTPRQQRIHAAVGTAAIAVTFVATIVVGAPTLDITPSSGDISTFARPLASACNTSRPGAI